MRATLEHLLEEVLARLAEFKRIGAHSRLIAIAVNRGLFWEAKEKPRRSGAANRSICPA